MANWKEVRRLALELPEATEVDSRGRAQWRVRDKLFVWERPLRPKEVEELGDLAPQGPVVAARVEHLLAKEALLASEPDVYFTTSHFDGHPSILARLERLTANALEELVVEAWLCRAPPKLVEQYLAARGPG
jgi:hypothetical protein